MPLFRRRRRDPLEAAWGELAERLGLQPTAEARPTILDLLALDGPESLGVVLHAPVTEAAAAYLFTHAAGMDPRTREPLVATCSLVLAREPLSAASWRAAPRMHELIASLRASAAGGRIVAATGDPDFDSSVTVLARDPEEVLPLLTSFVRGLVARCVGRAESAQLTVGEGRILLSCTGTEARLDLAEYLLSDALGLYAALRGRT